jgi:hypothetical protein
MKNIRRSRKTYIQGNSGEIQGNPGAIRRVLDEKFKEDTGRSMGDILQRRSFVPKNFYWSISLFFTCLPWRYRKMRVRYR